MFLSATPHNGHSNSFSTLLELLDPYRFTRSVKVRGKNALDPVMVRRLKEDISTVQGGFPERDVVRHEISGLPEDAPELVLSRLLDEYRSVREDRLAGAAPRTRATAGLLVVGLQQRLLSSIEAFARTLKTHRNHVEKQWEKRGASASAAVDDDEEGQRFLTPPDADDERADWSPGELEAEEEAQVEAVTALAGSGAGHDAHAEAQWRREMALLDQMHEVAEKHRQQPCAKTRKLLGWIRENMCPGLPPFGLKPSGDPPQWNNRRLIIFTENREGTKRYLREVLEQAIADTDQAEDRIEVIDGLVSGERRKEIQRRFNTHPEKAPLRILLATDAAREGLNFQAHCTDLVHFDLPWNPGRIEQRNGRIDRKLQPAEEVRCHYFVLPQRVEDRVLSVLVNKTDTIKRELGSLSKVIDDEIERRLDPVGHLAWPVVALWPRGGTAPRRDRPHYRALDRTQPAQGAAPTLRPRRRDENPGPARPLPHRLGRAEPRRSRTAEAARRRPRRHQGLAPPLAASRRGTSRACGAAFARTRRTREQGPARNP